MHAIQKRRCIGLAAIISLVAAITIFFPHEREPHDARAALAPFDPERFMLHAFLLPALNDDNHDDKLPRWIDPRPALNCGANTVVRVNGEPLAAGTLVPFTSFDYEWHADGCRPFGLDGPRVDGNFTLTVFREDWGLSATLTPAGLRYTNAAQRTVAAKRRLVMMPLQADALRGISELE